MNHRAQSQGVIVCVGPVRGQSMSMGTRATAMLSSSAPASHRSARPEARRRTLGDIIWERWAELSRNGGRHHSGIEGDIDRNPNKRACR